MTLRIDGKIITSLTNDQLGTTLQQIAKEIDRRFPMSFGMYEGVMKAGSNLRCTPDKL